MADLSGLIARLEALDGPSREVDVELCQLLMPDEGSFSATDDGQIHVYRLDEFGAEDDYRFPCPTASIDAAVALVERVGFQWLRKSPEAMTVYRPLTAQQDERKEWAKHHNASGATPAIALCIALLRAMEGDKP